MKTSRRISEIPMSGIRKMFDLAGPNSINLGLGEPDLAPPEEAIRGMNEAASKGLNKYGPTAGIPELRAAIAKRFSMYGELEAGNIMVTPSGSSALLEITQSMIDPGDEVLIPSPGFVIYGPHTTLAGGKPVEYRLTPGDFQPDIDHIQSRITPSTRMIVVTTPSNPTGGVLTEESKKALCDIAADKGITILSDEVYDSFVYEGKHVSFMDQLDKAVVVNGFSKMMAVTGWRMGFIAANTEIMEPLIKMQYHVCASPNMPAMYGILAALPNIDPYLENARKVFKARRDLISGRINAIPGMDIIPPRGAFYAFPSYDMDMKSADLAGELAKAGLICTPGSAFGTYGEGHLRFSYAADESKINAGMDILEDVVKRLR
ncbi:MAG: aminotransferase class I/II-fold pyridoxal phosphate-dependent enzyme [Candidatus Methanomethylophilaceae archaeon]|nr:aminotransferase class I/II-fold pyridoxal phosphate-dependent enzyme [Candidatus Methanomethylophilaceae archaeon]